MLRVNQDLLAAYIRGGDATVVEQLRTEAANRLLKLGDTETARGFRGRDKTDQINVAGVLSVIRSVDGDDEEGKRFLRRLVASATARLGS